MDKCKICAHNEDFLICDLCIHCHELEDKFKPMTNAQKIRNMTDEELADWICGVYDDDEDNAKFICGTYIRPYNDNSILEWLKQPVEEVNDEP